MMGTGPIDTPLELAAMAMLGAAFLITLVRFAIGPTVVDRVVALDVVTTLGIALVALYAIATEEASLIDLALAMGLITFIATVAFAYLVERSTLGGIDDNE